MQKIDAGNLEAALQIAAAAFGKDDLTSADKSALTTVAIGVILDLRRVADSLETIAKDGVGNVVQGVKLNDEDIAAVIEDRKRRRGQ